MHQQILYGGKSHYEENQQVPSHDARVCHGSRPHDPRVHGG